MHVAFELGLIDLTTASLQVMPQKPHDCNGEVR